VISSPRNADEYLRGFFARQCVGYVVFIRVAKSLNFTRESLGISDAAE
jgi:hypothetical protein